MSSDQFPTTPTGGEPISQGEPAHGHDTGFAPGRKPNFIEKKTFFDRKLSDRPERFEDFSLWQEARRLTNRTYDITDKPSFERDVHLRQELRRTAMAVMTALAEGVEANNDRDFLRGLTQARAAAGAVRSLVFLSVDRGTLEEKESVELQGRSAALGRMIGSQIARLKRLESTEFKKQGGKPPTGQKEYGAKKFAPRPGGYGKPPGKPYSPKPPYSRPPAES